MLTIEDIISKSLNIPVNRFEDSDSIDTIPEWDSISHMTLITQLEEHYEIFLTGDEIAEMTSVGNIKKIVNSKKNES